MSGLEFRSLALAFLVLTVPLSVLFGLMRIFFTCEKRVIGAKNIIGVFLVGIAGTYAYSMFRQWDDSLHIIVLLFANPIVVVLFVSGHVLAILLGTQLVGVVLTPKDKPLCLEYYFLTFFGLALFWNEMARGNTSALKFIKSLV